VRSNGAVDLVLAFLLFLEGDLAFRFDFMAEELTRAGDLDFVAVELPLMVCLMAFILTSLAFPSPSSGDEKNRDDAADRLVPCDEKYGEVLVDLVDRRSVEEGAVAVVADDGFIIVLVQSAPPSSR